MKAKRAQAGPSAAAAWNHVALLDSLVTATSRAKMAVQESR
jgi:hypothetical protein